MAQSGLLCYQFLTFSVEYRCLYLNLPTYAQVYGILNSLNIKTSTRPDDIPPYFIKTAASVLTPNLVFFISICHLNLEFSQLV